jgi:tRNA1Val (adenine37-N6)-methyltransferase
MAFRFKEFSIHDDRCAMKVGMDAVLLGAWADISGTQYILDIGTGSGVIALMLAQRSEAKIWAVEIDSEAAKQAAENVIHTPWSGRVNVENHTIQEFSEHCMLKFDLIVCNPPYFNNSLLSPSSGRNRARHTNELSYEELADAIAKLISPSGKCCIILPLPESVLIESIMTVRGMLPAQKLEILPKSGKPANRVLIQFENAQVGLPVIKSIYIRNSDNTYSPEYKQLTRDFYLNF